MLRVEEALRAVATAAGAPRCRRETVPLPAARGRVLAEDVRMDHDVPPFPRATMDGFAATADDLAGAVADLRVVGRVLAGRTFPRPLARGETVAVMTGAPVPAGTSAVVPVERSVPLEGPVGAERRVRLPGPVPPGQHVAARGETVAAGAVVLRAGTVVTPAVVGGLAVAGAATVAVAARPSVAVLATGDELVPVDARPGPASIRESNGAALVAQVEAHGGVAVPFGIVPDAAPALRAAVERALACDLVVLSGGVSVGDRDLVPAVLRDAGVTPVFHRWAVKPGGPLWFGHRGDTLVFGLPGNPAATFVGFELLVAPALGTRLGRPFAPRPTVTAVPAGRWPAPSARRVFLPVAVAPGPDGRLVATPVRSTGSGDPFALAGADGLGVVPETGAPVGPTCGAPAPVGPGPAVPSDGPRAVGPTVDVVLLGAPGMLRGAPHAEGSA